MSMFFHLKTEEEEEEEEGEEGEEGERGDLALCQQ